MTAKIKKMFGATLLVCVILFPGCAAVEYGLILNDHRGDLMSLNTEHGKRFYDVYMETLFYSPINASIAREHLKEHGFPEHIYCKGQLSNYLIYVNDEQTIFHFDQSPIGLLKVKRVLEGDLPSNAQSQLLQVGRLVHQKAQIWQLDEEQVEKIEEQWRKEYLEELSD